MKKIIAVNYTMFISHSSFKLDAQLNVKYLIQNVQELTLESGFKVVVLACYRAYFVGHVFKVTVQ